MILQWILFFVLAFLYVSYEVVRTYIGDDANPDDIEAKFSPYSFTVYYKGTEIKTIMYHNLEDNV